VPQPPAVVAAWSQRWYFDGVIVAPARKAAYSVTMETELNSLEQKINQLVTLCQQLRIENRHLAERVALLDSERKRLNAKVEGAKQRVGDLLAHLPEA
jgi:cell division protein ZapB